MLFVHAKDDSLLEAVATFFEVIGDLFCDNPSTIIDNEGVVEVACVVKAIFDFFAFSVCFPLLWTIAFDILVNVDLDYFVRRKKPIAYTLPERIKIDRLPEVVDVGYILCFFRSCCKTNLRGSREIFQNLAPSGIFSGASTVALNNDN